MRVSCSIELTNDKMKDGKETTHLYYFRRDGPNRRDCSSLLQGRIGRRGCPRQSRTSIVLPSFLPFPSVLVVLQISQGKETMSEWETRRETLSVTWFQSKWLNGRWWDSLIATRARKKRLPGVDNQDIDCISSVSNWTVCVTIWIVEKKMGKILR